MRTLSEMTPTTQSDEHWPRPSPSHRPSRPASKGPSQGSSPLVLYVSQGHGAGKARQPGGEWAARVVGPGQASGSCSPALLSQMRGIGLRAQVEPRGQVTLPSVPTRGPSA